AGRASRRGGGGRGAGAPAGPWWLPTASRYAPRASATRMLVARLTGPCGTPSASWARRRSARSTAWSPARSSARGSASATASAIHPSSGSAGPAGGTTTYRPAPARAADGAGPAGAETAASKRQAASVTCRPSARERRLPSSGQPQPRGRTHPRVRRELLPQLEPEPPVEVVGPVVVDGDGKARGLEPFP